MNFGTFFSLSLLFLCGGVLLACILKLILRYALAHTSGGSWWTVFCIFLSLALAAFAGSLVFNHEFISQAPLLPDHLYFYLSLALVSFLITLFWKILLPLFLILYLSVTFYTSSLLQQRYGKPASEIHASLFQDHIQIDQNSFPCQEEGSLTFEVTCLPQELLLPLVRTWYMPITEDALSQNTDKNDEGAGETFLKKVEKTYKGWIFNECRYQKLSLPESALKPALYNVKIIPQGPVLSFDVKRSL